MEARTSTRPLTARNKMSTSGPNKRKFATLPLSDYNQQKLYSNNSPLDFGSLAQVLDPSPDLNNLLLSSNPWKAHVDRVHGVILLYQLDLEASVACISKCIRIHVERGPSQKFFLIPHAFIGSSSLSENYIKTVTGKRHVHNLENLAKLLDNLNCEKLTLKNDEVALEEEEEGEMIANTIHHIAYLPLDSVSLTNGIEEDEQNGDIQDEAPPDSEMAVENGKLTFESSSKLFYHSEYENHVKVHVKTKSGGTRCRHSANCKKCGKLLSGSDSYAQFRLHCLSKHRHDYEDPPINHETSGRLKFDDPSKSFYESEFEEHEKVPVKDSYRVMRMRYRAQCQKCGKQISSMASYRVFRDHCQAKHKYDYDGWMDDHDKDVEDDISNNTTHRKKRLKKSSTKRETILLSNLSDNNDGAIIVGSSSINGGKLDGSTLSEHFTNHDTTNSQPTIDIVQ